MMMASSSSSTLSLPSSTSPSSSAVTLPRPGKSILKRAPPPQQSFFSSSISRLSKFLPAPLPVPSQSSTNTNNNNGEPNQEQQRETPTTHPQLKRAHFVLPYLTTVYPISTSNPPSGPNTRDEKRSVEVREMERRKRVVRGNSVSQLSSPITITSAGPSGSGSGVRETEEWWSMERVDLFYKECCEGREEFPHEGVSAAFKVSIKASRLSF